MSFTYTQARRQLKTLFDQVCHSHEPTVIRRKKGGNVVVLAEEDYNALEETAYLLRSPANAHRLLEAVGRAKSKEPGIALESTLKQLGLPEDGLAD